VTVPVTVPVTVTVTVPVTVPVTVTVTVTVPVTVTVKRMINFACGLRLTYIIGTENIFPVPIFFISV
jgi:hypothetical protein